MRSVSCESHVIVGFSEDGEGTVTWSANNTMMVYWPGPGGMYFTVKVSLSFFIISKSMSASAGPTTPGAHLIPMLTSPAGKTGFI